MKYKDFNIVSKVPVTRYQVESAILNHHADLIGGNRVERLRAAVQRLYDDHIDSLHVEGNGSEFWVTRTKKKK